MMLAVSLVVLFAAGTLFVLRPLVSRTAGTPASASSLQVYKSQLAEVDTDLARGLISATEAEAARLEIKRRILGVDVAAAPTVGAALPAWVPIAGTLACAALAGGIYLQLGSPQLPGHPYSAREEQAAVTASVASELEGMIAKLQAHLATSPDDLRALKALGWALMQTGDAKGSAETLGRAAQLAPDDAELQAQHGEALVGAANGTVSAEALAAFERVLARDPKDPRARYYKGLHLEQAGASGEALDLWIGVIRDSPPDAEWLPSIREQARALAVKIKRDPATVP
jgi:cytochrome c-type biogenesis protein CcmH